MPFDRLHDPTIPSQASRYYQGRKRIGSGGMGGVWLAQDTRLKGRQVALKFLPETVSHDPDAIDDLKRELLLSQELTHENIVRIFGFVQDNQASEGVS